MKSGEHNSSNVGEQSIHELQGLILQWIANRFLEMSKQGRAYWGNFAKDDKSFENTLDDFKDFVNLMSDTNFDFLEHIIMDLDKEKARIGWTINKQSNG